MEAARLQRRANRGDLGLVVAALVEERIAEPRAAALAALEPRLGLVDVRQVIGDAQFAEVRVGEAVVGNDVAGRDIGLDPLLAADAVVMPDLARHDIECRLLDARLVQPGDQPDRALVGREEGAAAARHVVEGEGDALVGRGGGRREDQQQRRDQPAHVRQRSGC